MYAIVVAVDEYNNGFEKKKLNQIMISVYVLNFLPRTRLEINLKG